MRDRRLAELEIGSEVADAHRLPRLPQGGEHGEPGRIAESLEQSRPLFGPFLVDRRQCAACPTQPYHRQLLDGHECNGTRGIDIRRWLVLGSTHRRSSMKGEIEMSEINEAVRSRYANAAKQIAVINAPGSVPAAGCCQADG